KGGELIKKKQFVLFMFGLGPPLSHARRVTDGRGDPAQGARRPVSRVLSPPERGMTIPLGRPSPGASRDRPGWRRGNPPDPPVSGGSAIPTWSCSRWGLPCRRRCRRRGALLPHPFTLAAHDRPEETMGSAVCFLWHFP